MQRELVHVPITINQPHVLVVDELSMLTSPHPSLREHRRRRVSKKNM